MERKYTVESFDKFTNVKKISTLRHDKFNGFNGDRINQSIMLHGEELRIIDAIVGLYASAVYALTSDGEEIYIEFLNYFHDGNNEKGDDTQNFKNSSIDFVMDDEIMSIKAIMINDHENRTVKNLKYEELSRRQIIKFPLSKEEFTRFCSANNVSIRISGIIKPRLLSNGPENIHEFDSKSCKTLQTICKQLYNESFNEEKYDGLENVVIKNTNSNKSGGCFIATAAMGDYNHPVVMDLRLFRDEYLSERKWGINFTNWYYKHGPKAARVIQQSTVLRILTYLLIVKPLQIITKKLK